MQKWFRIAITALTVMLGLHTAQADDAGKLITAAERFVQRNAPGRTARKVSGAGAAVRELTDLETGQIAAYVVDLAPSGYVVLGPDETVPPVVLWSPDGHFPDGEVGVNPYVTLVVRDITARRDGYPELPGDIREEIALAWEQFLDDSPAKTAATEERWPAAGTTSTDGWLETAWIQLAPYNAFCPLDILMDDPERSPTGCVPTALSQIINYHQYIGGLQLDAGDSYFSTCGPEAVQGVTIDSDSAIGDFPTFDELNSYLSDIDSKYSLGQDLTDEEIAALNFAVGILAETQYSWLEGSGAADDWFFENFVEKHGIDYTYTVKSPHELDFYATLKSNIMNGLPVALMINKTYVCTVNHEVVVDGYSTSGFYHLNFGWGDSYPDDIASAWYLLPEGMGSGYDLVQIATMDIRPANKNPGSLTADSLAIDLGYGLPGAETASGSAVITNTGEVDIEITGLSTGSTRFEIGLDTTFTPYSEPFTLPAGGAFTLYARCTPDSVGTFRGEALVYYEGGHCLPVDLIALGIPSTGTVVSPGQVSGTWTHDGSPYLVTGNIEVWSGAPLFIKPGVEVLFLDRFELTLQPGSTCQAIGTSADSIYFRPYNPERGWYGITIVGVDSAPENEYNQIFDYCVVTGGTAAGPWPQNIGGAFRIVNTSPRISHCSIIGNTAAGSATAVSIEAMYGATTTRAPYISNTVIAGNHGSGAMGAVKISGVTGVRLDNVTITSNTCKYGGALALQEGASVYLTNCILWNNRVVEGGKGGVINLGSDVHYNTVADTVVISYSAVDTTSSGWMYDQIVPGVVVWGDGCITDDPVFADETFADYTLAADSPCIDTGSPLEKYRDPASPDNPEMTAPPAQGTIACDMGAYGGGGYSAPPTVVRCAMAVDGDTVTRVVRWDEPVVGTVHEYRIYRSLASAITVVEPWPGFNDINEQIDAEWSHTYLIGSVSGETFEFADPYDAPEYLNYHYWVSAVTGSTESEKILAGEPLAVTRETPRQFRLDPAFPNPFNPATSISFQLPSESRVRLTVYDILGRTVRILEDDVLSAGAHTARWNGLDDRGMQVSSGVYLYRLVTPEFTGSGKLLLMR